MKKKIVSILGVLLVLVGIFILSVPLLANRRLESISQGGVDIIQNQISSEEIQNNLSRDISEDVSFDFGAVDDISDTNTLLSLEEINRKLIVGQLVIPSIELNLALLKGTTNSNLHAGAATMKPDQELGKGNFAVAGHYARNGVLFGHLTEVEKGDVIRVTDKISIYEYTVYKTKSVSPDRVDLISDYQSEKHGGPILSLMNCHYIDGRDTGNRYFVFAELTDRYPYSDIDMISM